jgi:hypothetical protein
VAFSEWVGRVSRPSNIDGVKSELVVGWAHSVQGRPEAIADVLRILRANAGVK